MNKETKIESSEPKVLLKKLEPLKKERKKKLFHEVNFPHILDVMFFLIIILMALYAGSNLGGN